MDAINPAIPPTPLSNMATFTKLHIPLLLVLALSFSGSTLHNNDPLIRMVGSLGINYGQLGSNLPPPERVAALLTSLKLTRVRIYDTNPEILKAFANSGIELIVTIENEMLATLSSPQQALHWVSARIKPFYPATRITDIAVGNEVYKGDGDVSLISNLVPAMSAIRSAMAQLGLAQYIHLSTPHALSVLSASYPPSAGTFRPEIAPYMLQFLQFLSATGSPFWINAYPYYAYKSDPPRVSLDYALSNPSWSPGSAVVDPNTRLKYDSMLYAQVDAVVFAMKAMGFGGVEVRVAETGWPSAGDRDEAGATVENAAAHNRNLLRRQMKEEGTPMRPGTRLEVYLFALFNEDLKPGPGSERNYGLYQPDETMVYNMGLSALSSTGTTTSAAGSAATSVSLSSSATKVAASTKGWKSVVYGVSVHLLAFKIFCMRRLLLHF